MSYNAMTNDPFPRVLVHEGLSGGGSPLVVAGKVDDAIAAKIAKFRMWCCQPGFLYESQRFALDAVRAKNPALKVLAHFVLHTVWGTPDADTGYQSRYAAICARPGGVYMNTNGTKTTRPNITNPERLAEFIALWLDVLGSGAYDGVMLDPMCAWTPPNGCDWTDGGRFASLADLYVAQERALGLIFVALRSAFPKGIIIGCGGPKGSYDGGERASGWWQENFPQQNPVGWVNVTRVMLDGSYYYASPHYNVIAVARAAMDPFAARTGLATACLGDGVFCIGPPDWKGCAYYDWWLPEYGIDCASGAAMTFANGWLGLPLEEERLLANGLRVREFEHGFVAVNPTSTPTYAEFSPYIFAPVGSTSWTIPAKDARFWRRM